MILGIDEVGRGPWAGPLVVGAVVLGDATIGGLNDSKKLSDKKRRLLDEQIRTQVSGWGLGWVHANELDSIGLSAALRLATRRAVEQITVPYHEIIIDGTINFLSETSKGQFVTLLPKADSLIPSVSAASIIAKVARDTYMAEQDAVYPGYGFGKHVGYGTAAHRQAIDNLGVTPLHRISFAPIAKIVSGDITTKSIGDKAELEAEQHLVGLGYEVVERNWRTRWCEIDRIMKRGDVYYFVEVKYRKNANQGDGFAAITAKKRQQMTFATELYVAQKRLKQDLKLVVVAVSPQGVELVEL